jgi:hypothetical protein
VYLGSWQCFVIAQPPVAFRKKTCDCQYVDTMVVNDVCNKKIMHVCAFSRTFCKERSVLRSIIKVHKRNGV